MNDPHVVHLEYSIEHGQDIDWSKAETAVFEEGDFTIEINDQRVFFKFKKHYASEDAARADVEPYIQNWEFEVGLKQGPDAFALRFVKSDIVDQNPPDGVKPIRIFAATGRPKATINIVVRPNRYPDPPPLDKIKRTPDIDSMYHRYLGYRAGREPLPSMAYFCLDMLKYMAKRDEMAPEKKFCISRNVLEKVSKLSSWAGGEVARKSEGLQRPFDPGDEEFLRTTVQKMIFRTAEVACNPNANLEKITMDSINPSHKVTEG